jgi:hypothetical protein
MGRDADQSGWWDNPPAHVTPQPLWLAMIAILALFGAASGGWF